MGGRVGVGTPYLPLPPPLHPGKPCRARSEHGAWVEWWGRGRGRSGIVGPPFTPLPLARPRRKQCQGKGGRGGGNHPPIPNPPLAPTRPHPWHRPEAPKVGALDGSGKGVGRGGTSRIIIRWQPLQGQAPNSDFFFFFLGGGGGILYKTRGKCCPFFFLVSTLRCWIFWVVCGEFFCGEFFGKNFWGRIFGE